MAKLTTEEFIQRGKEVHGEGTYDYSMVNYTHSHVPVTIKCNICGTVFEQRPFVHWCGSGCPVCGKKKNAHPLTQEDFIRRSKETHGDKYDYSETVYRGWDNNVQMRCKEHGILFSIRAGNHFYGAEGCPECLKIKVSAANTKPLSKFIEQARKVHGDKYGYSKVVYRSTFDKVTITCPTHGDFEQTPSSHLAGYGCYWCGRESQSVKIKNTQADIIRRAKEVHGDKYDYSKVVYKGIHKKIIINCPKHGDFLQTPNTHLQGHGCPECGNEEWLDKVTSTTEDFIERARDMHGNEYDYSLVDYVNQTTKVKIICKKHGVFEQTPHNHLHWQGCPKCSSSIGERRIMRYLEKHGIKYKHHHRVPYKVPPIKSHFEIDFYLPDYGLFIEYNGQQHYKHIAYWKHDNPLPHRQARDAALRKYCEEREDIRLLEIPYTDFDRIEEILERELKA